MIEKWIRVSLFIVLAGGGGWAQTTTPVPSSPAAPTPFGSGERPPLHYEGDTLPKNMFSLSLAQETAYDDNVWSDNTIRQGDAVFGLGGRLGFRQERKHLTAAIDYQPDFRFYRKNAVLNPVNHGLQLDLNYQISSRFSLRLRDSLLYQHGIFHPRWGEGFIPELDAPTRWNNTVFKPLAVVFENNLRLDTTYRTSRQTSFNLFGDFLTRNFLQNTVDGRRLLDSQGFNGGIGYAYQFSRSDSFGILYLLQNLRLGNDSRTLVQGALFSIAHQFSPRTDLTVFGGPQYARLHEGFQTEISFLGSRAILTGHIFQTRWEGAFGGVFTYRSEQSVFQLSARQTVADGGGLLSTTTNSLVEMLVTRRLGSLWRAGWTGNAARTKALGLRAGSSIQSRSTGVSLERILGENLSARLDYNFLYQRSSGPVRLQADLDRNRLSLGIFYQVGRIAWGR